MDEDFDLSVGEYLDIYLSNIQEAIERLNRWLVDASIDRDVLRGRIEALEDVAHGHKADT